MFYNGDSFVVGYNQDTPIHILAFDSPFDVKYFWLSTVDHPYLAGGVTEHGDLTNGGTDYPFYNQRSASIMFICTRKLAYIVIENTKHYCSSCL